MDERLIIEMDFHASSQGLHVAHGFALSPVRVRRNASRPDRPLGVLFALTPVRPEASPTAPLCGDLATGIPSIRSAQRRPGRGP